MSSPLYTVREMADLLGEGFFRVRNTVGSLRLHEVRRAGQVRLFNADALEALRRHFSAHPARPRKETPHVETTPAPGDGTAHDGPPA